MLFYVRRVPKEVAHLDHRKVIRQSLRTRDPLIAGLKARAIDEGLEKYWKALLKGKSSQSSWQLYASAVDLASSLGFTYRSVEELVAPGNERDLVDRVLAVRDHIENKAAVDALLGNAPAPSLTLGTLYSSYEENNSLAFSAMSPKQLRHHEGQRKRAIEYAKSAIGDKALEEVTRADVLRFRQWWIDKTQTEGLTVEAANKCFSNIKGMLTVVDDALHTDYGSIWSRLLLKSTASTKAKQRPSYPNDFIQNQLLKPGALEGLNRKARMIVYLMVETGLRPSEACNLRPEDIVLGAEVPHVAVRERTDRVQKTDSSVRTIPLVGVALGVSFQ